MPTLREEADKYIYDAILNQTNSGPKYTWNPATKVYDYSNSKFPNKNYKKTYNPSSSMSRGDVIHFDGDDYRNANKMIFNGEKLVDLYYGVDDYGSVPPEFVVGDKEEEFDIGDFEDLICHNSINWLSKDKLKEIIFSIDEKKNKILGKVTIKGKEWKIILDIYNYSEFENSSMNSKKFKCYIEDEDIYINNIKDIPIKNQKYLIKAKAETDSISLSKLVEEKENLSFIHFYNRFTDPPCSEWIAYRSVKEYKLNLGDMSKFNFPLILERKSSYSSDSYIFNQAELERMLGFSKKDIDNIFIKEIIGYPVIVELLEKDNDELLEDIKEHIKYVIDNDINLPFSQEGSNVLSLNF